jgi:hypothetical protein
LRRSEAWIWDDSIVDPFWCEDALFRNAAEYLQAWGQRKTDNIKLQLYQGELWLCRTLKLHVLGIHHWRRQLREKDHGSDGLGREMSIPGCSNFQGVANGRRMKFLVFQLFY